MQKSLRQLVRRIRAPLDYRHARSRLAALHARGGLDAAVDLALRFGGRGLYNVRTTQLRWEIASLAGRVAELRPRVIVEIGTAWGGTLLLWAQLASREVITCDLSHKPPLRRLAAHFAPPGGCRVTLLQGDSHRQEFREEVWARVGAGAADFLFIDGDHTESGVEQDYREYGGLVRPGGLIAFHDIVERQPVETNQVERLWRRLRGYPGTEELVHAPDQCGFGIGLVTVPADGRLPEPAGG